MEVKRAAQPGIQHAEKTIAFDGTAGKGAVGGVTLFTVTGRHVLLYCFGTCSESLAGATATLDCRMADGLIIIPSTTATDLALGDIWIDATPAETAGAAMAATQKDIVMNGGATTTTLSLLVATAAITDGTLTISIAYLPISPTATIT